MNVEAERTLEQILGALWAHADYLRARGVVHAAVFGSVARGEAGPESDVDILVTLDDQKVRSLLDYAGVAADLEDVIGRSVDLADSGRLRPEIAPLALGEAIDAF